MKFKRLMEAFFGWKVLLEIPESNIAVVKRRDDRILLSHNIIYSMLKDNSIYTGVYWDYFIPMAALHKKSRVLILGLAGGTVPYQMNRLFSDKVKIDAVEIDRNMVKASKAFLPRKLDARIIVENGASYIGKSKNRYDTIVFDMFKKLEVPDELWSDSFMEKAHAALKSDGVMAVNFIATELSAKEYMFKRKLRKHFKVYTIREPRLFGNHIFICSKRLGKEEIVRRIAANLPESRENSFIFKGYRDMKG